MDPFILHEKVMPKKYNQQHPELMDDKIRQGASQHLIAKRESLITERIRKTLAGF